MPFSPPGILRGFFFLAAFGGPVILSGLKQGLLDPRVSLRGALLSSHQPPLPFLRSGPFQSAAPSEDLGFAPLPKITPSFRVPPFPVQSEPIFYLPPRALTARCVFRVDWFQGGQACCSFSYLFSLSPRNSPSSFRSVRNKRPSNRPQAPLHHSAGLLDF